MEEKKKEAFWFKYFWGAKGKQKHRRRAVEGEAVSTCPKEQRQERPSVLPQASGLNGARKAKKGKEKEGDYQLIAGLFKLIAPKNYTVRL